MHGLTKYSQWNSPLFLLLALDFQSILRNPRPCHVSQLHVSLGLNSEDAVITSWSGPKLSRVSAESEKTPPIIALCVCERERVRQSWQRARKRLTRERGDGGKEWEQQADEPDFRLLVWNMANYSCSLQHCRCVSSCLSSSVTVVIWGLNPRFTFNYVSAEIFFWRGYHFQAFGWHFVWPNLVFLSDLCVIFLSDLLSNLFSHLLISARMPVAFFWVWNRLWKLAFKTELKHSGFWGIVLATI